MFHIVDETHEFLSNEEFPEKDVANDKSKTEQRDQTKSSKPMCVILTNDERTTGNTCNYINT